MGDTVTCLSCHIRLKDWEKDEDAGEGTLSPFSPLPLHQASRASENMIVHPCLIEYIIPAVQDAVDAVAQQSVMDVKRTPLITLISPQCAWPFSSPCF